MPIRHRLYYTVAMRLFAATLAIGVTLGIAPLSAQTPDQQDSVKGSAGVADRAFFPKNSIRGFVDFDIAPPHNEIDLGLCRPAADVTSACAGFARYVWSGYLEVQPFGVKHLRRLFLIFAPRLYTGNNLPHLNYTWASNAILWEENLGLGVQLWKTLEFRYVEHRGHVLGKYAGANSVVTLRADGPYGSNSTLGVRWYFGGYGHAQ